ncbi:hypothetical protein ACIB24_21330 [Spongisporangium articulatum]|uniref:DUF4352 domain-containing protein n=1 Tax=Spongisporangium articulatum TaxID=3362603 RepID=A0ABW8AT93_9ACTN
MTPRRSTRQAPNRVLDALDSLGTYGRALAGVAVVLVVAVVAVVVFLLVGGGDDASPTGAQGTGPAVSQPPVETSKPGAGVKKAPEVKVGSSATLQQDVTVKVVSITPVTLKAQGIGEIAGAGAAVKLQVGNASAKPIDLGQLVVNASYGAKKTPAPPNDSQVAKQLRGSLKAGKSATGTYLFKVPSAQLSSLRVEVSSGTSPYVITFVRS